MTWAGALFTWLLVGFIAMVCWYVVRDDEF